MPFMKRRRGYRDRDREDHDPLNAVANLFDLGMVLVIGFLLALLSASQVKDHLNDRVQTSSVKKGKDGQLEILTQKGKKLQAMKVSRAKSEGRGEKLGTAYRLEDGTMVYVPEMDN